MERTELQTFLTGHYYQLQNFRFAPFWLLLLAEPLFRHHHPGDRSILLGFVLWLLISAVWYWGLNQFYLDRYGRIKSSRLTQNPFGARFAGVLILALATAFILRNILFGGVTPSGIGLIFIPAYFMLGESLFTPAPLFRKAYLRVFGISTFLYFIPFFDSGIPAHQLAQMYIIPVLGAFMLFISVLDHIVLTRGFAELQTTPYV